MKILILQDMPLFPYRIYAYNELAKRGYDLTVVSINDKNLNYNIPLNFIHKSLTSKKYGPFILINKLNKIKLKEFDCLIISPNVRVLNFLPKFFLNKNIIGWGHMKGQTKGNKYAQRVREFLSKRLDAIIFYERNTKEEYIKNKFPQEKLFVANNTQYVDKKTIKLGNDKKYFLYVGRIQERKGLEMAIAAFAQIKKEYQDNDLKFMIVGDGDKSYLERTVSNYGIEEAVIFLNGIHEQNKLGEIFSKAIAYVSPGHVGLGVLHSFACGVPVITCVGRKHSVEICNCNEKNSMLVPYSINDLATAMKILYTDSNLQKKMGKAAYDYYNNYCTIDKMVDGIDEAIKYVML